MAAYARRDVMFTWGIAVLFLLLYCLSRWVSLTLLPIHFDEIIYLDRVHRIVSRCDLLIGLRDDLRTGHLWVIALFWPLSPDHLWAGRFASTLAGLLGVIGTYKSANLLFSSQRIGLLAALLYLFVPGLVFYDRMAMADSLLTACGVWLLYISASHFAVMGKRLPWGAAPIMALAVLTKPSGALFLAIPFLGLPLMSRRPVCARWVLVLMLPFLVGCCAAFALILPNVGGAYQGFVDKIDGPRDAVGVLERAAENITLSTEWLVSLASLPVCLLAVIGAVFAPCMLEYRRISLWLIAVVLVQWLFFAVLSTIWYPRYLLPIVPPLLLLALIGGRVLMRSIKHLAKRCVGRIALQSASVLAFLVVLWPSMITDLWLLTDPSRAPLHSDETRQYITGWPSGYGLAEIAAHVRYLAAKYPEINIAYTDGIMVRKGLPYYLPDAPSNVEFETFRPRSGDAIDKLDAMAASRPTFVVLNTAHEKGLDDFVRNPGDFPQARHVFSVYRPGRLTSWDIYEWIPSQVR